MVATAVWFIWPVIIWRAGAKKWRLALPLFLGFVALLPSAAMCLVAILISGPSVIQRIAAGPAIAGQGNVGQFILQTTEQFGGTPTAPSELPHLSDQWSYLKENNRVVIKLSNEDFPATVKFLQQSFSNPSGYGDMAPNGEIREYDYRLSTNGACLYIHKLDKDTEVIIQSYPEPTLSMKLRSTSWNHS